MCWSRRTCGVAFGLCGGLIALIFGTLVTAVSWFIDPKWHGVFLHQTSTVLFVVAMPLLIFGAHCLDLLDKDDERTSRLRQCEKTATDGKD